MIFRYLTSIQKSAARFYYNNYSRFSSVSAMQSSLNLPPYKAEGTEQNYQ